MKPSEGLFLGILPLATSGLIITLFPIEYKTISEGSSYHVETYSVVKSPLFTLFLTPACGVMGFVGAVMVAISVYRLVEPISTQRSEVSREKTPPPPSAQCPTCNEPMELIKEYGKWYCWKCKKYA